MCSIRLPEQVPACPHVIGNIQPYTKGYIMYASV